MKWRAYPAYRESGVEWLGEIPEHWGFCRAKSFLREINKKSLDGHETLLSVSEYDGVRPRAESLGEGEFLTRAETLEGYKCCEPGDLIMNIMLAWKRGQGIAPCSGIVSPAYAVYRPSDMIDGQYLHYLSRSDEYVGLFGAWSYGVIPSRWRLYPETFLRLSILYPPLDEQKVIATFLDRETSRIDELIAKKQRQIELLQEKRSALISHVVTKGLDPNAKMKDSGVEWLGEIPEHWAIYPIKRVSTRIQTGCTPPTAEERYYELGTIPWYGPRSFGTNLILSEPTKLLNEDSVREGAARIFVEDSVMVVTIGATIGKVGYLASPASSNQQITAISPNQNDVSGKFLTYQLKRLEPVLRGIAPSTTLPIMDQQELGGLPCALPGLDEQKKIVQYIDLELQKIDGMIETINKSIDLLREYRTALISAAVTGKIDVREEVA